MVGVSRSSSIRAIKQTSGVSSVKINLNCLELSLQVETCTKFAPLYAFVSINKSSSYLAAQTAAFCLHRPPQVDDIR